MAAPAQRRAIEGERQYFTFRLTRRTVPMTFSMMFVQASERRSSGGSPSFVTVSISSSPSRIEAATPAWFKTGLFWVTQTIGILLPGEGGFDAEMKKTGRVSNPFRVQLKGVETL